MTGVVPQPTTALAPHTTPTLTSANVSEVVQTLRLVDNNRIQYPQLAFHTSKCKDLHANEGRDAEGIVCALYSMCIIQYVHYM